MCQFLHGCFKKAELPALIRHIAIILKSGIPIYNSKVSDTAGTKTRRRTTQTIVGGYAFHTNIINIKKTLTGYISTKHQRFKGRSKYSNYIPYNLLL